MSDTVVRKSDRSIEMNVCPEMNVYLDLYHGIDKSEFLEVSIVNFYDKVDANEFLPKITVSESEIFYRDWPGNCIYGMLPNNRFKTYGCTESECIVVG